MVFDFLRRVPVAAPRQKASATGRVVAWGNSGRIAWSPRDAVSLTKTGFQGNPIGFRVVKLISEAAAALPLILQDHERRFYSPGSSVNNPVRQKKKDKKLRQSGPEVS